MSNKKHKGNRGIRISPFDSCHNRFNHKLSMDDKTNRWKFNKKYDIYMSQSICPWNICWMLINKYTVVTNFIKEYQDKDHLNPMIKVNINS